VRGTALTGLLTGPALVVVAVMLWSTGAGSFPAPVPELPAAVAPAAHPGDPAPPVRVRIGPADAPVVAVGVDERGAMAVPPAVHTVGWYRFGPRPGAPSGSSVLAGHVDDRVQGPGAFTALRTAEVGDVVEVDLADGATLRFRVRTVEEVGKGALPVDRLFARSGPARLALVTCGGGFDRGARSYRQNVVVTAEPVG
jgi:hypothetical protein